MKRSDAMTEGARALLAAAFAVTLLVGHLTLTQALAQATPPPASQPPEADAAAVERGLELTAQFYAGEVESLLAQFSGDFAEVVGGAEGLRGFQEGFLADVGAEVEVVSEQVAHYPGAQVYQRVALFERHSGEVLIEWALDEEGTVIGLFIGPVGGLQEAHSDHLDHETRTKLRLPFDGEWWVGWGGRSLEENYHAAYPDQRFAYDFLVVRGGSSHVEGATGNEGYHCFGLPILAPGAGAVVAAVGGEPDRAPGEMIDERPLGNHVVIDHGNGEFSFLAHLRQGSVLVEAGQLVEAGEQVGECGNSGRSSEPHLHYHLQTTPEFGAGEGLPAQFNDYVADGQAVPRGEPVQGQFVRSAE